jgi:hypothetical protein
MDTPSVDESVYQFRFVLAVMLDWTLNEDELKGDEEK